MSLYWNQPGQISRSKLGSKPTNLTTKFAIRIKHRINKSINDRDTITNQSMIVYNDCSQPLPHTPTLLSQPMLSTLSTHALFLLLRRRHLLLLLLLLLLFFFFFWGGVYMARMNCTTTTYMTWSNELVLSWLDMCVIWCV